MKKIGMYLISMLILMFSFVVVSCKEKEVLPYDEDSPTYDVILIVDSVGDYVEYSCQIKLQEKDRYFVYKSVYLKFVDINHNVISSKDSNDYVIHIGKDKAISPKELKVGQLLIFKAFTNQEIGEYLAGNYLEYKMIANLEVESVGDVVKYKMYNTFDTTPIDYLTFELTEYECDYSFENDYYIIDGDNKMNPLDLKVGDKLYFEIIYYKYFPDTKTQVIHGSYLYLVRDVLISGVMND